MSLKLQKSYLFTNLMINNLYRITDQYPSYHFSLKFLKKLSLTTCLNCIDTNNILYDNQFGFRKNHSTTHAIITLVERVSKALDTGKIVVGVYLDLKKHSIL